MDFKLTVSEGKIHLRLLNKEGYQTQEVYNGQTPVLIDLDEEDNLIGVEILFPSLIPGLVSKPFKNLTDGQY